MPLAAIVAPRRRSLVVEAEHDGRVGWHKGRDQQAQQDATGSTTTWRYLAALHKAENPYAERLADLFASA
jgi:hypothetical protein